MKILSVTTLYPNAAAPSHGIFVENRLAAFRDWSGAQVRVVAPVPWFPIADDAFGAWGRHARAPARETRRGITIMHPRYAIPPRIGMRYAPFALSRAIERAARTAIAEGFDFDLIDAHYLYPDGVAAAAAAARLGKPFVLTARGSDATFFPRFPDVRRRILDAVQWADAVIAVSASLKGVLEEIGAPRGKVRVLRNGVDLATFSPQDQAHARAGLGIRPFAYAAASVGNLIERKGHDIAIRAIARTKDSCLLVVGEGPFRARLEALSREAGVADRVRFLGRIDHERLAPVYAAADALILASAREGWPNVLLEAMACGTRVVAADVGGVGEVVSAPEAGETVKERTPEAFADALDRAFSASRAPLARERTRRFAEGFSWDETSETLADLFAEIRARRAAAAAARPARLLPAHADRPRLLVTVDAEESFDWSRYGEGRGRPCAPSDLDPLAAVCAARGARPLFFLTHRLLADPDTSAYFRRIVDERRADAGLHLHGWATPPLGALAGEYHSFQTNLPRTDYLSKLKTLAAQFQTVFGAPARAHRAGRYGVGAADYAMLAACGITHDFSPSPGFDFRAQGGPDFSGMTNHVFAVATPAGSVFVTPVSGALAVRGTRRFFAQPTEPDFSTRRGMRRPGRWFAPMRVTCENACLEDIVALTRRLHRDGVQVITFSLHSTSMTAGANPYATDAAAVAAMRDLTARYLDFFTDEFGGELVGFGDLERLYAGADMLNPQLRPPS